MLKLEIKSYIHKCKSTKLRTPSLQEQNLTFEKVQNIGKIMKQSAKQNKNFVILQLYSLLQSAPAESSPSLTVYKYYYCNY